MQVGVASTSVTRTLSLAQRTIGSRADLAAYLGVAEAVLQDWLDGQRQPPIAIYLRALDLVANGPFTRYRRRASRE
jgi:DNA-binding transcriptional regulator YiaG